MSSMLLKCFFAAVDIFQTVLQGSAWGIFLAFSGSPGNMTVYSLPLPVLCSVLFPKTSHQSLLPQSVSKVNSSECSPAREHNGGFTNQCQWLLYQLLPAWKANNYFIGRGQNSIRLFVVCASVFKQPISGQNQSLSECHYCQDKIND